MRKTKSHSNNRLYLFAIFLLLGGGILGYRLVFLTVSEHAEFTKIAQSQYVVPSAQLSNRGSIFSYDNSTGQRKLLAGNIRVVNEKNIGTFTRTYPLETFASQVLGFVGYKGSARVGQYGVEGFYHEVLSGIERTQTPWRYSFFKAKPVVAQQEAPKEGEDIVLTIDPNVQAYAESALQKVLKKYSYK